uniref:Uncharacterized protein n=1 Tax=Setaria digitata TaxID=48799 RepID=A0A915PQY9_9BILA
MTGTHLHRTRQTRLLRYMSRRKPCRYLLLAQFGILVLFTGLFVPAMLVLDRLRKQLAAVKAEHRIYQSYVGSITLSDCHYMYPQKYEVPCHEKPAKCNFTFQMRQCPGVNGIYLPRNLSITSLSTVKIRFNLVCIAPQQNSRHRDSQLQFSKTTTFRGSDNICYRQVETVREGWPEHYRICDSEVPSENRNCNTYI